MWEARDAQSIIQAAEKAAAGGSYTSAEKLLRQAARMQEANLGPRHPDLANTLNNLGIVCEMTGKPDDAEQYFRRAVSIARTSLDPDHPFVTTSQKNLREFCEARGKSVELPAALSVPPPTPTPPPAVEPTEPPAPAAEAPEDPVQTSKKFFYRMALGGLGPIAMLMVILAAGLPRLGPPELAPPARNDAIDGPAPPPTIAPAQPVAVPEPVAARQPETRPKPIALPAAREAEGRKPERDIRDEPVAGTITSLPSSARPVVVRASLCGDLDDWSCDPADRPVPEGPLFFYTQITSPNATTVQHRWYQGNHLRQAVELRVQANGSAGYRTYSRNLMKSDSAGDWRVEVRSQDGALLHEERFSVR